MGTAPTMTRPWSAQRAGGDRQLLSNEPDCLTRHVFGSFAEVLWRWRRCSTIAAAANAGSTDTAHCVAVHSRRGGGGPGAHGVEQFPGEYEGSLYLMGRRAGVNC
jgi:hypothetical protein